MQLLTLDNESYLLDRVPDHVAEDMRFAVLDNSDPSSPDFFFIPLIYLESFSAPSAVLQIGDDKIQMPLDWHILLGDPECGDLEIVPLTSLNDRVFHAFCFNPISDSMPSYKEVRIVNIYNEVEWFFPRTKSNQLISVPILSNENPPCAFFIKEINRNTDTVLLDNLFHA